LRNVAGAREGNGLLADLGPRQLECLIFNCKDSIAKAS